MRSRNKLIEKRLDILEGTDIVRVMWNRLPTKVRSKVTLRQLGAFVDVVGSGGAFSLALKASDLSEPVGQELLTAIENTDLV